MNISKYNHEGYHDGSSTAMSTTGPTLNITPSDVTNKASYIAQLEG